MGAKKQGEKSRKMWTKVLAIIAGVFFVIVMVLSAMGSSWLTSLVSVKPGDVVVLDYTIKDPQGTVLITSNQQTYKTLVSEGSNLLYSKQLTVTANQSYPSAVYPVQIYTTQTGWGDNYAIFASEYDAISNGILGMKTNDQKTITIANGMPMTQFWSAAQLMHNNLNITSVQVGDIIPLGVSDNPAAAEANSTASYYIRLGEITNKTADGVTFDFSHPAIQVTVVSITSH
jgi:signal peptidase I